MRDAVDQIALWLLEQHTADGVIASHVKLVHVNGAGAQSGCARFAIGERGLQEVTASELAARAYNAAIDHAAAFQSLQVFAVELWWQNAQSAGASKPFRVAPPADALQPTEAPTSIGLVQQAQRHLEATQKMAFAAVGTMANSLASQLTAKDERIKHLESKHMEVLQLIETLVNGQQERDLRVLAANKAEARKDEAVQAVKLLAAPIMAQLSKRVAGVPTSAAADSVAAAFMSSLSTEQLNALLAPMTEPQRVAFMTAYRDLVLVHERDDAKPQPNGAH